MKPGNIRNSVPVNPSEIDFKKSLNNLKPLLIPNVLILIILFNCLGNDD